MMGYRSQVACVISVDRVKVLVGKHPNGQDQYAYEFDQDKFREMVGLIKLTKFWELWHDHHDALGWADGRFVLYGDDWKWYPDYEDVKEFHNMFNQMQAVEGISGYFMRVGEEHSDVEEEHFGDDPEWDMFHAFTGMNFNGEEFLNRRETEHEEKPHTQGELDLSTPTSQGN